MILNNEPKKEYAKNDGYSYSITMPIPDPLLLSAIIEYEKMDWIIITAVHTGTRPVGKMVTSNGKQAVTPTSALIVKKWFKTGEEIENPKIELKGKI